MLFGFALSGLQEFLYDLSPQTPSREDRALHGGRDTDAARRLRIRSAMLSLVPSLVARELDPSGSNILYLGGGKLFIAADAHTIQETEPKLRELYDWLVARSAGKLGAYWSTTHGTGTNSDELKELLDSLGNAKWRAGRPGGWHQYAGQILRTEANGELGDRDWEARQGAEFARDKEWAGFNVGTGPWRLGPWRVQPVKTKPDIGLAGKTSSPVSVSIPTYTPKLARDVSAGKDELKRGDTAPLYLLAEQDADGKPRAGGAYLALLKLDGDGIGALIHGALGKGLAEYMRVSQSLSTFFGTALMEFLEKKYPRLYLVYSGGDDLVATGHFEDVLDAAVAIRREFEKLGLGATVSAGISFYTRNSPILKAIENAQDELDHAKEMRNGVSISGCRLSWEEMATTLKQTEGLAEAVRKQTLNRGAFQLLRHLGDAWLDEAPEAAAEKRWRSIPMLQYMRSRRTGWKETEWPSDVKSLFDSLCKGDDDWPRVVLMGSLAAWKTKQKEDIS